MDWVEFIEKMGRPDIEINQAYFDKFINNKNAIGITIYDDADTVSNSTKSSNYEKMLYTLEMLNSRGAIQGKDYIISITTVEIERAYKIVTIYTTKEFMSQEDFII